MPAVRNVNKERKVARSRARKNKLRMNMENTGDLGLSHISTVTNEILHFRREEEEEQVFQEEEEARYIIFFRSQQDDE